MDNVTHPGHYRRPALPECQELIDGLLSGYSDILDEFEIFCLGNVIKYIYRAPLKNKREDLKKAGFYMDLMFEHERHDKQKEEMAWLLQRTDAGSKG